MKMYAEPYRIKMVEPLQLNSRNEREHLLTEAGYNLFSIPAADVYIDLLTDSGTSAMSQEQWARLMLGDESYAGSRSFYRFQEQVEDLFCLPYVLPTHQGRGAENVLFQVLIKPGQYVVGNMHFDTTRAQIALKGGYPVDLVSQKARDPRSFHPFKGDIDIEALEDFILEKGRDQVAFILLTVTCNSVGGQPVSMENIKETGRVAARYQIPFFLDGARFAENAFFIKEREAGFQDTPIEKIVQQMFSYTQGGTVSAKKDGLVNIGGFVALRSKDLYQKAREVLIAFEGFPTYGGLAGRDLEALTQGLKEVVSLDYLKHRFHQVRYLGDLLKTRDIPILEPVGGHAVYIDAGKFLPHLASHEFPGQSLVIELYREGGIRSVEIGSVMAGRDAETGLNRKPYFELVRLALPRRVYTDRHLEYVALVMEEICSNKEELKGLLFIEEPSILRHFTATFRYVC